MPTTSSTRAGDGSESGEVCPICQGMGFITLDLPPAHPQFGRAVPCQCTRRKHESRLTASLEAASNLHQLAHMTFASFHRDGQGLSEDKRRNLQQAFDLALSFADNPQGWLFMFGGYGCGKTHLAAAIARQRIDAGEAVLFAVVPDLLDHLRAAYAPDSTVAFDDRFQALREAPLLVLDDLGTQSSTPWAQEKLYQLLNYRYNLRLPTVITSNLRLEDIELRLRSRLGDPTVVTVLTILAPDFRMGAESQNVSDLSTLGLHAHLTFERFDPRTHELPAEERENLKQAVLLATSFAERPQGWLVFSGKYGGGKTHLAAAIANRRVQLGQSPPMFIVVPDLLDHLRASFGPHSQVSFDRRFEAIRECQLLILDDLGTESATPWAKEKLFQLLNHRYIARLPTVITTSKPLEELEPRIASRMMDLAGCTFFAIIAPSYRGQVASRRRSGKRS